MEPSNTDTGRGTSIGDYLPIPASDPADVVVEKKPGGLENGQTFSHALATESQEDRGLAQKDHDKDVVDLGWNEKKQDIAAPLVGGMDNEELWLLVRRFNKVGVETTKMRGGAG